MVYPLWECNNLICLILKSSGNVYLNRTAITPPGSSYCHARKNFSVHWDVRIRTPTAMQGRLGAIAAINLHCSGCFLHSHFLFYLPDTQVDMAIHARFRKWTRVYSYSPPRIPLPTWGDTIDRRSDNSGLIENISGIDRRTDSQAYMTVRHTCLSVLLSTCLANMSVCSSDDSTHFF